MEENKAIFKSSFIPWIIKWGRSSNLLGVLLCFGPCIGLAIMGYFPEWSAFAAALAIQLPSSASAYVYEPISYFAVLGIPGTYMSFLSGNISNLRVPASSIAQEAAGVEEGSDEGTIVATIGIAVSTFINIIILTIGVVAGAWVLAQLPPIVSEVLNLLLPALFAALLANYIVKKPKLGLFSVRSGPDHGNAPQCRRVRVPEEPGHSAGGVGFGVRHHGFRHHYGQKRKNVKRSIRYIPETLPSRFEII